MLQTVYTVYSTLVSDKIVPLVSLLESPKSQFIWTQS